MSAHRFSARRQSPAALAALDFGLRVRVDAYPLQRSIFSGAERFSAQDLASELGEMISQLRVRSFAVRAELEQLTTALLSNLDSGFGHLAHRAALDLGGLLAYAGKRRFAERELCVRGANACFRIAELIVKEVA
jgi:uncharacterized protein with PIN domain